MDCWGNFSFDINNCNEEKCSLHVSNTKQNLVKKFRDHNIIDLFLCDDLCIVYQFEIYAVYYTHAIFIRCYDMHANVLCAMLHKNILLCFKQMSMFFSP